MMYQTQVDASPVQINFQHPVLVPVDFSTCSRAALLFASGMAQQLGSSMLILHVVHETVGESGRYRKYDDDHGTRPMEDIAADMLDDFVEGVNQELDSACWLDTVRKIIVSGLPATRINEVAIRENAAFIIMGGRRHSGIARLVQGSVLENVIHHSNIPVTVINASAAFTVEDESGLPGYDQKS